MNKKIGIVRYTLSSLVLLAAISPFAKAESPTVMEGCTCSCPAPTVTDPNQSADDGSAEPADASNTGGSADDTVASNSDSTAASTNRSSEPYLVFINELLPDPEGRDTDNEFIELVNRGNDPVDLTGWTLQTASRAFAFENGQLLPNQPKIWLYSATKLTLTNSGTTIKLQGPDNTVIDAVSYDEPVPTGQSWSRTELGNWQWSEQPTPGLSNVFPVGAPAEAIAGDGSPADSPSDEQTAPESSNDSDPVETSPDSDGGNDSVPTETEAAPDSSVDLIINEFLPDPEGSDDQEWIEIWNRGQETISLIGWHIDDQEGGSQPFALSGQLLPNEIVVLDKQKTGLALNNGGDTVRLIAPNGETVDQVTYQTAPTGNSFARNAEEWFWTDQLSPGYPNPSLFPNSSQEIEIQPESAKPDDSNVSAFEEAETVVPMAQIPDLEDNELITTEGIVTLPFGVLGKTIFMIQDEVTQAGAEIRVTSRNLPQISQGSHLRLTGRLTPLSDGWRLSVRTDDITQLGSESGISAHNLSPEQIVRGTNGILAQTKGIIASRTSQRLRLTDESGIPEIDIFMADGGSPPGEAGQELAATGVIHWNKGKAELVVASLSDLSASDIATPETPEGAGSADAAEQKILTLTAAQKPQANGPPTWLVVLTLAAMAGIGTWTLFNRRRAAAAARD